ncbi:unnamed protein product [Plasmodium vivax]|uniref:(malaria parasite P. vivax) hypothetical protein n=1 Tax=Plasmodium vivax TaxID=5855 RepID=A0A8S4HNR0_PLAVI|nr:unnamed protein product [Plasmodium vivax]
MPINEDEQIPNKFNSRLDESQNESILKSIATYNSVFMFEDNNEIKDILAKLIRNVRLITSEYSGNPKKRCRDVNYWFNKKIKEVNPDKINSYSNDAITLVNEVKWNTGKKNQVCKIEAPYKNEIVEIMKKLDDYCEIRDNNGCSVLKNKNECLKYNEYIKERKEYFSSSIKVPCNGSDCKKNDYTIDASCTLNDMDLTFPEINCDTLYKKTEIKEPVPTIKERSPLEIGFFIIVSFILFYLFILFLDKFTPVGSIISRFRRRKYDLKRNFDRMDDDRYSLYHSEKIPSDSENKRYYIEYARPDN